MNELYLRGTQISGSTHKIAIDHLSIQNGTGNGLLIETDGVDLIVTDSSFAQNYIYGDFNGGNIAILYVDPLSCVPRRYNSFIINTNASFGDSDFNRSGGILIYLLQRSYSIVFLLDSVIAHGNKGIGNIYIAAAEHDVSTYNITINNSLSSGANGYALVIQSLKAYYKQCPVIQTSSFDFAIMIFNSNFTHNNNIVLDAAVFINLIGVKFTTRIIVQSTEMSQLWIWAKVQFFLLSI